MTRPADPATSIRHFAVVPPPGHARWLLIGLLALPAAGWLLAVRNAGPGSASRLAVGGALLLVAAVAAFWGLQRRNVSLEGNVLVVRVGLLTRRVALDAIVRDRSRVVDLDEHIGLQPQWRLLGMSLPGFHTGWYRPRSGGRGFYLVTTKRVLWLPVRDAAPLLLSLVHPAELLDVLPR